MGSILQACKQVLTFRRIAQLGRRRLKASEFVKPLAHYEPVYADEEEAYKVGFLRVRLLSTRMPNCARGNEWNHSSNISQTMCYSEAILFDAQSTTCDR